MRGQPLNFPRRDHSSRSPSLGLRPCPPQSFAPGRKCSVELVHASLWHPLGRPTPTDRNRSCTRLIGGHLASGVNPPPVNLSPNRESGRGDWVRIGRQADETVFRRHPCRLTGTLSSNPGNKSRNSLVIDVQRSEDAGTAAPSARRPLTRPNGHLGCPCAPHVPCPG